MQPPALPTFIIAGAQRSGTTLIYNVCDSHPEIYMAKPSFPEPKFFHVDHEYRKGIDHYSRRYFANSAPFAIVGEKSANYLEYAHVPKRIRGNLGEVKLVFALRNPIERAYSNYLFSRGHGLETESFDDAIRRETAREAAYDGKRRYIRPFSYVSRGMYARHLSCYLAEFSRSSIHILLFDDLVREPATVAGSLYAFLGARPNEAPADIYQKTNSARGAVDADGSQMMTRATYDYLRDIYQPANAALMELIGRDTACWDQCYDDYRDRLERPLRGR